MEKNNYRIGIVGGMGPMAGVMLQELIIKATPAEKDQDHLEVICFTNSHIPDRMQSLRNDDGKNYVAAVVDSIKVLEGAGADCAIMPCNTAHARFGEIQKAVGIPVLNMIEATLGRLRADGVTRVGLLATDGTIASGVFRAASGLSVIVPEGDAQQDVMNGIYEIKAGRYDDETIVQRLKNGIAALRKDGAERVILGCTELSLYRSFLEGEPLIDPLVVIAEEAVKVAGKTPIRISK